MGGEWGLERTPEGVLVRGEIDLATADEFGHQLSEIAARAAQDTFQLNLSGLTFMDSSGLHALVAALEVAAPKDIVIQPSPQVYTLLTVVGLAEDWPNVVVLPPNTPQSATGL